MERNLISFRDILEPRRTELSNFLWVSRQIKPVLANKQSVKLSPQEHKIAVLASRKIQAIIEKTCKERKISKLEAEKEIKLILDEIGFNRQLKVIRWLGLVLIKICKRVCTGLHVNEDSIARFKSVIGNTPVIFVPSHRSYADFILMSYLCFHYDIEIPVIAAGMDFHAMWGMGKILRDTGAFFMRRSFTEDYVYWETFKQYVYQLVTKGDSPIEFFIEGTRSRSGKSLIPKLGLLTMALKPFFMAEVPDIYIVPINISYERTMEEKLFAFELLGVPKPKESTSALFKSMSVVKENYGNIYCEFAEPISIKELFGDQLDRSQHTREPLICQEITQQEKELTVDLAHQIVQTQQRSCVIGAFNIISVILTSNLSDKGNPYTLSELIREVNWLNSVLQAIGALTDVKNAAYAVSLALQVHKNLVEVREDSTVDLVPIRVDLSNIDATKLKGYSLSEGTMCISVPRTMLQLYVNPCLHYLVNPAIVTVIMRHIGPNVEMDRDEIFAQYQFFRSLLSNEFVLFFKKTRSEFEESMKHLEFLSIIETTNSGRIVLGNHKKLQNILCNMLTPFLDSYKYASIVLTEIALQPSSEKTVLSNIQERLEKEIYSIKTNLHPYSLNLDTLTTCLHSLAAVNALEKTRVKGVLHYKANVVALKSIVDKIDEYTEPSYTDLEKITPPPISVHLDSKL